MKRSTSSSPPLAGRPASLDKIKNKFLIRSGYFINCLTCHLIPTICARDLLISLMQTKRWRFFFSLIIIFSLRIRFIDLTIGWNFINKKNVYKSPTYEITISHIKMCLILCTFNCAEFICLYKRWPARIKIHDINYYIKLFETKNFELHKRHFRHLPF